MKIYENQQFVVYPMKNANTHEDNYISTLNRIKQNVLKNLPDPLPVPESIDTYNLAKQYQAIITTETRKYQWRKTPFYKIYKYVRYMFRPKTKVTDGIWFLDADLQRQELEKLGLIETDPRNLKVSDTTLKVPE